MRDRSCLPNLVAFIICRIDFRRWLCAGVAHNLDLGSSILLSSIRGIVRGYGLLGPHGYGVNPVCGDIIFRSEVTNDLFGAPLAQIVVVFLVARIVGASLD